MCLIFNLPFRGNKTLNVKVSDLKIQLGTRKFFKNRKVPHAHTHTHTIYIYISVVMIKPVGPNFSFFLVMNFFFLVL